jgi:phosphoribosylformimino-5-aminoimidazole carboxamide ribotide isomerase
VLTQLFDVIPAIDVLQGRVVRLREGRRNAVTLDAGDPVTLAARFQADGARRLHLVDLDGAFDGRPSLDLLRAVVGATTLPVQVGGGYRTLESVAAAIEAGADRVMVGTAALDPTFLHDAVTRFRDRLVVAIDARDGVVVVDGWTQASEQRAAAFARRCAAAGVARLLVTSASHDGSLAGLDLGLLRDVLACGLPVVAAGGVSSITDLVTARDLGCEAAIAGTALLRGRFALSEALTATAPR